MPQPDRRNVKDEVLDVAVAYHDRLWKARKSQCDIASVTCPYEKPPSGVYAQSPTMELLVTIVEATCIPKKGSGHDDRVYCFAQRDWELREIAPAGRGGQRFPEWHEVIRFPLYEDGPNENRAQRTILGGRLLFLSCGTNAGGFLGMTCVKLTGVFLRNTQTLDGWYTLMDGARECGAIYLELSIADRPKRMRSSPTMRLKPASTDDIKHASKPSSSRRSTITNRHEIASTSNFQYPKNLSAREEALCQELTSSLPDLTGQVVMTQKFSSAGGGYSDVWMGRWEIKSLTVAIKRLRTPFNTTSLVKLQKSLKREVRIWRKLNHKNVAPLYGLASDFGPISAMVCPWYDQGNLVQYLALCGPSYPIYERFRLLIDIAAGLCHLHELGVIHGDLKGANILIDDEGNASLCDFGLSSIVAENDGQYFTSTIGATIRWAAPEVHRVGSPSTPPEITPASDIYSFGSVMLETLTGQFPYYDLKNDFLVMAELIIGGKPRRPPEPVIAEEHWALMTHCWADDMRMRPDIVVVLDQLRQCHRRASQ